MGDNIVTTEVESQRKKKPDHCRCLPLAGCNPQEKIQSTSRGEKRGSTRVVQTLTSCNKQPEWSLQQTSSSWAPFTLGTCKCACELVFLSQTFTRVRNEVLLSHLPAILSINCCTIVFLQHVFKKNNFRAVSGGTPLRPSFPILLRYHAHGSPNPCLWLRVSVLGSFVSVACSDAMCSCVRSSHPRPS